MTYAPLLHRGFDNLDIAFQGALPPELYKKMAAAKERAIKENQDMVLIEHNGVYMHVADCGMKGGYALRCDTGPLGATWAFKRSMRVTDWNIYVSSKSLTLAVHGLEGTKQYIYDTLDRLGIRIGAESIGRVDYALDFLLPSSFTLDHNAFVSHWHTQHKQHHDLQTVGTSGHLTSVTLGKMPGKQIIVYDKRADVISKHKDEWWDIWNMACAAENLPLLQKGDCKGPRVWRIELRAGKRHLKDHWGISRWHDLDEKLPYVFLDNIARNRYCIPTTDSNRSRWPDHPLWQQVREAVESGLPSLPSGLSPDRAKEIKQKHFQETMERQVAGIMPSYAVALGLADAPIDTIIKATSGLIRGTAAGQPERWQKMMKRAKEKRKFITPTPER